MATFTFGRAVDIHWQGYEVVGPAGTVFSIPDQLYDEFNDDIAPVEPTLAWVDTNEFLTLSNSVSVTTLTGTIPISVTSTTSGKTVSISSTTNPAGYYLRADGTGATTWAALPADATGITNIIGTSPISAAVVGTTATISLNANYQTAGTYVTGVVGTSPISATGTTAITVSLNANYQTAGTYVNAVIGTSPASVSTASGTSTVSIVAGSIDSSHLSATSVGSSQLINGSVTSDKLGAASVVAAKISSGSVGTVAISSGSATSGQILQANGSGGVSFSTPVVGAVTLISSTTVGTATQTLTLSSIPQTYSLLRLVIRDLYSSTATAEQMEIRINGLTTATYGSQRLRATSSTADAQRATNDTYLFFAGFNELAASASKVGGFMTLDFYNYADTSKAKYGGGTFFSGNLTTNAMSALGVLAFMNQTTSAITSLEFVSASATNLIAVGSKFDLYGVS